LALLVALAGAGTVSAQQSYYQRFRANNAAMTARQPGWMGPLIQSDARLGQALRLSYSNSYSPGADVMSYGNNHGISVIALHRLQFDYDQPAFLRNHSATQKDGFGNAATQIKCIIASGNAEHGNFALTGILNRSFTPGSSEYGALTGAYNPKLAAGKAFGRFNVQSTLGGVLPTGHVAAQGRAVEWNLTGQVHPNSHTWFDIENNAAFQVGGPFGGKTQDFITPAAFYMIRRKNWPPAHALLVFDGGMQIATSSFHFYNHNLVAEARILF
jgi:hypothetical protein